MNLSRIMTRADNVLYEELNGEVIAVNKDNMVSVALSEHGTMILNLCNGDRSIQQLIELIANAYPDQADEILSDVIDAVSNLEASGLLFELPR